MYNYNIILHEPAKKIILREKNYNIIFCKKSIMVHIGYILMIL
jgi:hypothetical protein